MQEQDPLPSGSGLLLHPHPPYLATKHVLGVRFLRFDFL